MATGNPEAAGRKAYLFWHFNMHRLGLLYTLINWCYSTILDLPGGSVVKNLIAKQEMWVQSLIWEYPLEKEMAIHSSILA